MEYCSRVGNERDLRPAGERHPGTGERTKLATDAWAALLQVHAVLVPKLDRLLTQATGLPLSWYDVLLELAAAPGRRLLMGELAERVVLSRTRVSRIVDELVTDGLVYKEVNPDDGRSAFAVLTADGLARYRAAAPAYLAGIENEFAAGLTEAELATVARALRKVITWPITPRRIRLRRQTRKNGFRSFRPAAECTALHNGSWISR
jgi:DNA-binding MarR family transcriptional regulator